MSTSTEQSGPARYRVVHAEVEALQWTGWNAEAMAAFCGASFSHNPESGVDEQAAVLTVRHSSWEPIYVGGYAVRGPAGFFVVAGDVFAERYTPVVDVAAPADPMPVFVIKAQDRLAIAALEHYMHLCRIHGLDGQADEVGDAKAEITMWQERNPDRLKLPDHKHVPAADGLYRKFQVARVDGRDKPGGDRDQARYFVLDYAQDPYAAPALRAYADACEAAEPGLAADLRVAASLYLGGGPGTPTPGDGASS